MESTYHAPWPHLRLSLHADHPTITHVLRCSVRCHKNPTYMKKMCPEACKDKSYDPPSSPPTDEVRSKKKKRKRKKKKAEDKDEV